MDPLYKPSGRELTVSSDGWEPAAIVRPLGRFGKPTETSVCNVRESVTRYLSLLEINSTTVTLFDSEGGLGFFLVASSSLSLRGTASSPSCGIVGRGFRHTDDEGVEVAKGEPDSDSASPPRALAPKRNPDKTGGALLTTRCSMRLWPLSFEELAEGVTVRLATVTAEGGVGGVGGGSGDEVGESLFFIDVTAAEVSRWGTGGITSLSFFLRLRRSPMDLDVDKFGGLLLLFAPAPREGRRRGGLGQEWNSRPGIRFVESDTTDQGDSDRCICHHLSGKGARARVCGENDVVRNRGSARECCWMWHRNLSSASIRMSSEFCTRIMEVD